MADDNKEKLAAEKEITAEKRIQTSITGEAQRISQEDAEIQRRVRDSQFGITQELKEQLGIRSRISEQDRGILSLSRQVTSAISESNRELRRQGELESQILKEKKLRAKTQQNLTDTASELSKITSEELEKLIAIARTTGLNNETYTKFLALLDKGEQAQANQVALGVVQIGNLEESIKQREREVGVQREVNKNLGIAGALTDNLQRIGLRAFGGLGINLGVFEEGIANAKQESTALAESFTNIDEIFTKIGEKDLDKALEDPKLASRIVATAEAYVLSTAEAGKYKELVKEISKLESQRETDLARLAELNLMEDEGGGLSGKESMERLSLLETTIKSSEELKVLRNEQAGIAVEAAKAANSTGLFSRRLATIKKLGPGIGEALKQGIIDPFSIGLFSISNMLKAFGELNKEAVRFQRLTGQTVPLMGTMNLRLATTVQYLEVASILSERLGMNVTGAFSSQNLAAAAELMNVMGMTAEQAGQLALVSEINRTTVDKTLDTIVSQVNAYNRTNRTALNHGQIVNDIAKASEETLASFAGQPQKLTQAAAAARRLGMELKDIERIADNLLDFESSIEAELEAQLITGQNINLAKARELALSNNLEGVGKEIFNNTVGIEKFSRMNRIEQQSMAKALGMSRQELARIALQRGIEVGLTNKALENAAGMTAEDFKRVEAMQQLTVSIQKIGQALAGPAEFLASMLSSSLGLYTTLGLIGTITVLKMVSGFGTLITQSKSLLGLGKARAIVEARTLATKTGINKTIALQTILEKKGLAPILAKLAAFVIMNPIAAAIGTALAVGIVGLVASQMMKTEDGVISPDGGLMVSGPKGSIQLHPEDSIVAGTNLFPQSTSISNDERLLKQVNDSVTNQNTKLDQTLSSLSKSMPSEISISPSISIPQQVPLPSIPVPQQVPLPSIPVPQQMELPTINFTPAEPTPTVISTNQENNELLKKIDDLIMAVKQGGDVYMDSQKVGESLAIGTYKSS